MKNHSFRQLIGAGVACAALSVSAIGLAAPAGAAESGSDSTSGGARHHRLHLTDEQKQCLEDQGVTRPVRPLTKEKIAALKAAAKACDIKLPKHLGHKGNLTDEQKQCMEGQGITRPIRPLTPEKIAALKAAAQACGIELPNRGGSAQS